MPRARCASATASGCVTRRPVNSPNASPNTTSSSATGSSGPCPPTAAKARISADRTHTYPSPGAAPLYRPRPTWSPPKIEKRHVVHSCGSAVDKLGTNPGLLAELACQVALHHEFRLEHDLLVAAGIAPESQLEERIGGLVSDREREPQPFGRNAALRERDLGQRVEDDRVVVPAIIEQLRVHHVAEVDL